MIKENILYLGSNVQLVEAMLNSFISTEDLSAYHLCHLASCDALETTLAEKDYSRFICELPIQRALADKIKHDFPFLKTIYLNENIATKKSKVQTVEPISECLKSAIDSIRIPIYYKNKKGEFLACNSYFAEAVGMKTEQIVGKTAAAILPTHLLAGLAEVDKKIFSDKQEHLYECEYVDATGVYREVVFKKEQMEGSDIQIGTIWDMSEINNAKRLLEQERLMLRATADISADLIFFKDLDSRFLGCNKEFEKFVGCTEENIIGKKDEELFELEQALMCQVQDHNVLFSKKTYLGEEHLTYKNGQRHFIEMRKVPLTDKNGQVQGLIGVGRDVTAHYQLQKRLKVTSTVFENSRECILVTDELGNIIAVNRACSKVSGFSKSELLKSNINRFATTQHAQIEQALAKGKSWQGDINYHTKKGDSRFAWLETYIVKHSQGLNNRIYSFTDIKQNKRLEEKVQYFSKHDPLTGLFNRIALISSLENAIARAIYKETAIALVLIDINGLKTINDQYGHNEGDAVLKEVAKRLKSCVFEKDTVARFGDDEFVIIIDELATEQDVALIARKIAEQFNNKFAIKDIQANLSATIGITIFPDDGEDVDALFTSVKKALRRGKADKSAPYHFYTKELTLHSNQQLELEAELEQALKLGQFELYYQPQYDLGSRQIVAIESLLRWNHPQQGVLTPESFSILLENSGLSVPLGLKMLAKVTRQAVNWQRAGINFGRIATRISEVQLSQISFIADLQCILKETKCLSKWLEFEIDEVVFASESVVVYENLQNISKLGIALTVDNYGANRPTLSLFEQLRIEKFRISKDYIKNVPSYFVGDALIKSVTLLARSLGIDTVGDEIGNTQQETISRTDKLGSVCLQSKAMKASEATFYLRCNKRK